MPNTRISALPAASTPLAGTELVPIVQGGITEQVSVTNLTAGRAVSATTYTVTGSTAPVNGMYLYAANSLGWSLASTQALWLNSTGLGVGLAPNYSITSYKGGAVANYIQIASGATGSGSGNGLLVGVDASGNGTITAQGAVSLNINVAGLETFNLDSSNNAKVTRGNLVIGLSGKGIDFSATSHATGMTSELLSDYEEGTWTPVVAAGSISGTSLVYTGRYTKIGRAVTITFRANSTSASNDVVVGSYVTFSGLPFTATIGGSSFTSTEDIDFKRGGEIAVTDGSASLSLGACGANPGTSTIYGSLTYFV
jgi:hypothetical protein